MKRYIGFFIAVILTLPAYGDGHSISGTVIDIQEEPVIGARVDVFFSSVCTFNSTAQEKKYAATNTEGEFKIEDIPESYNCVVFSAIGHAPMAYNIDQLPTLPITLSPATAGKDEKNRGLGEVVVTECGNSKPNGIKKQQSIEGTCYPIECYTEHGWELQGTGKAAKCLCTTRVVQKTIDEVQYGICEKDTAPAPTPTPTPKTPDTVAGRILGKNNTPASGASISVYKTDNCTANPNVTAIKTTTTGNDGAYSMEAPGANCIVVSYPNCETKAQSLQKNTEINITLNCTIKHENVLSEEDKKKQIEELEANAKAMKDKEQSTANKLIGAAGIGLTGAGLRNTMEGMAEMQLDANAEQAMKAYLQTFRCNYGGGSSYKGGETNIELPGAGVLMPLVTEYKTLAAELKETKLALDMKPGIESEEILDSATMGLHDDERHGIESGAFTSVSRALLDENGEDAAAWAAQQSDAKHKRNQGIGMAVIGAAGSAIASGIVNKGDDNKENSSGINKDFDKKRQTFMEKFGLSATATLHTTNEQEGKEDPAVPVTDKCYDTTNNQPTAEETACASNSQKQWDAQECECKCNETLGLYEKTPGVCECKTGTWDGTKCATQTQSAPATCNNSADATPCQNSGGTWSGTPDCKCTCPDAKPFNETTKQCTTPNANVGPLVTYNLSNGSVYESGSYEVANSTPVQNMLNQINGYGDIKSNHKIYIFAHTDPQNIKKDGPLWNQGITTNQALSNKRAETMRDWIVTHSTYFKDVNSITATGCADTCFKQLGLRNTTANWDKVRRVHILLVPTKSTAPTCASICADNTNWQ